MKGAGVSARRQQRRSTSHVGRDRSGRARNWRLRRGEAPTIVATAQAADAAGGASLSRIRHQGSPESRMSGVPLISVVVPVYNEEESIPLLLERLAPTLAKIGAYQILFAVDPCTDD